MDKKQIYATSVVAAGLGGVFVNLLSEAIKYLVDLAWGKPLEQGQRTIIWVMALLVVGGVLWIIFAYILTDKAIEKIVELLRPQFVSRVRSEIEKEAYEKARIEREVQTGIVKMYPKFDDFCKADILMDMRAAEEIRIFLQLGRTVIHTKSPFWICLNDIMRKPEVSIKILHASKQSHYFSKNRVLKRGTDLDYVIGIIEEFKEQLVPKGAKFAARQHSECPFWRIFIFDNTAYVQPYLYYRLNEDRAPVFKLTRRLLSLAQNSETKLLYEAFLSYFDKIWEECVPTSTIPL